MNHSAAAARQRHPTGRWQVVVVIDDPTRSREVVTEHLDEVVPFAKDEYPKVRRIKVVGVPGLTILPQAKPAPFDWAQHPDSKELTKGGDTG